MPSLEPIQSPLYENLDGHRSASIPEKFLHSPRHVDVALGVYARGQTSDYKPHIRHVNK